MLAQPAIHPSMLIVMKIKAQTMILNKAMKEDTLKTIWLKKIYWTNVSLQHTSSEYELMLRVATKR